MPSLLVIYWSFCRRALKHVKIAPLKVVVRYTSTTSITIFKHLWIVNPPPLHTKFITCYHEVYLHSIQQLYLQTISKEQSTVFNNLKLSFKMTLSSIELMIVPNSFTLNFKSLPGKRKCCQWQSFCHPTICDDVGSLPQFIIVNGFSIRCTVS